MSLSSSRRARVSADDRSNPSAKGGDGARSAGRTRRDRRAPEAPSPRCRRPPFVDDERREPCRTDFGVPVRNRGFHRLANEPPARPREGRRLRHFLDLPIRKSFPRTVSSRRNVLNAISIAAIARSALRRFETSGSSRDILASGRTAAVADRPSQPSVMNAPERKARAASESPISRRRREPEPGPGPGSRSE